jgi:DNA-binding CsgD family transcriptional regulator
VVDLGDQSQCAESAEALWPYASTFVVLGIGTPIGPAGWFLANALAALGRRDEALAANQEAGKVSARSRSQPWMQRCRTQRARLLRTDKRADVFPPPDAPEPLLPTRADRGEASRQAGPGSHPAGSGQRLASLHTDDLHLLGWVGHGMTNQAIARRLSVSVPTIERRLSSIYRTLGVSNRAQAVSLLAAFTP